MKGYAFGEQHYAAKLTWEKVHELRDLSNQGQLSVRQLAAKYRVSSTTIHAVLQGKTWRGNRTLEPRFAPPGPRDSPGQSPKREPGQARGRAVQGYDPDE